MTLSANDRLALRDVVHRYAARVDDRQFDSVTELFTASAELALPEPPDALEPTHFHRGQQAIAEAVAAVAAVARTEHAIIGELYDEVHRTEPRGAASRVSPTIGRSVRMR